MDFVDGRFTLRKGVWDLTVTEDYDGQMYRQTYYYDVKTRDGWTVLMCL